MARANPVSQRRGDQDARTELIARLATYAGHVTKVGKALEQAAKAHNQAVSSLESRVVVSARKFERLGIAGELPEPQPVATLPRILSWDPVPSGPAAGDGDGPNTERRM